MVDETPKPTRKRNASVEIRDSTVGTEGGDIVGRDKVLGAKVYIDKLVVGAPPSPYKLAKSGRVEHGSERIFISYSRKDGAEAAAHLREWLLGENLSVWQDLITLEGGRDWWSQIEDALKSKTLQHFVLVVTPAALASPVVRREIRLARQEGKTVCPIRGPGLTDLNALPRWIGHVYDLDIEEQWTALSGVLREQSRQKRVPMMAPEPPSDFVKRPVEFDALKKQLLDSEGDAVAITAALRGAGGYGKTTLAKALAHDADIQDAYFDGVLWATLGEKPESLLLIISDLIARLTGTRPGLDTINAAASALSEALGDRRILLVVDDVWRDQDLAWFLQGGTSTTRLVTTRDDRTLPANAVHQSLDAMRGSEALELITKGLPATQQRELMALAGRVGEWPLLLKLVNGFLYDRVARLRQALPSAIAAVNKRLDEKGLVAFDARNEAERAKAVARTIGVSLELLDKSGRDRFAELGVFAEDAHIPIGIVEHLWREHLDEIDTEDLLREFYGLSLLLGVDFDHRTLQVHDTIRHFLRDQTGADGLITQQKRLVQALDEVRARDQDASTRYYYYMHLPYHLAEANDRDRLDSLLLDPSWLTAKLAATANTAALVADYDGYALGEPQQLIGRTLRLASGICARDQRQLIPQLLGRLMTKEIVNNAGFLNRARQCLVPPAILEEYPSLTPPGAETARLEGHSNWITALCVLPDGRLASGSFDNTIRLWDVARGAETARLEGHSHGVIALCMLPDGRLASGSSDNTIRLWDVARGAETARLEGHSHGVSALCVLPDGRLASGSFDNTIRLWDVARGAETARLEGHSGGVSALCVLPDGRLASGSSDNTIRLWDVARGAETARLEGHSGGVSALCVLPDGRLASGSWDNTIRLWDVARGAETARLEGHSGEVNALCVLPDGRLASGSSDNTIRLWDVARGAETARLEGHSNWINALCVLPDGRLASGSSDNTIRLWDVAVEREISRLEVDAPVSCLAAPGSNGRLVAGDGLAQLSQLAPRFCNFVGES